MGSNRFCLKTRISDEPQPTMASSDRDEQRPVDAERGSGDRTVNACRQLPFLRYTTVSPSKIACPAQRRD
jgi:hypothetical protein